MYSEREVDHLGVSLRKFSFMFGFIRNAPISMSVPLDSESNVLWWYLVLTAASFNIEAFSSALFQRLRSVRSCLVFVYDGAMQSRKCSLGDALLEVGVGE